MMSVNEDILNSALTFDLFFNPMFDTFSIIRRSFNEGGHRSYPFSGSVAMIALTRLRAAISITLTT